MENQYQPPVQGPKGSLPNATAVLVLGICSIVFSCFFIGLACSVVGIVLANKGRIMYRENPNLYDGYSMLNAGWIMSIIGVVLGSISIVCSILWGFAVYSSFLHHGNYNY